MVLLWVYRAAEIKKNLLSRITSDSIHRKVRYIVALNFSSKICVCFSVHFINLPSGWPSA
jgi:hypothetical protein